MRALLRAMRPHQWVKNMLVLAPLLFAQQLLQPGAVLRALAGFAVFSLLAGTIYLLNDLVDVEKDRLHPQKRHRPLASGQLSESTARQALLPLGGVALVGAWLLNPWFLLIAASYAMLNLLYSFWLKRWPYIDVFCIALGHLLRVLAGAVVISVVISRWLLPCTFLLAFYMALGKRRHELGSHGEQATQQRAVLAHYQVGTLDLLLGVVASLTALGYCGYTLDPLTLRKFHTPYLIYTIPFVVFGIVRFLQLMLQGARRESPTEEILRDIPSLLNVLLWVISVVVILYVRPGSDSLFLQVLR